MVTVTSGPPGWWVALLVLILVLGAGGTIVGLIVRTAVLRRGSLNPLVDKEQLEVKLAQHLDRLDAPPPARKTIEERLAELDDLHRRSVISDDEHKDARAKVIAEG